MEADDAAGLAPGVERLIKLYIRVELPGKASVGAFDFEAGSSEGDAQRGVVIYTYGSVEGTSSDWRDAEGGCSTGGRRRRSKKERDLHGSRSVIGHGEGHKGEGHGVLKRFSLSLSVNQ